MSVVVLISGRGSNMRALIEAGIPVAAVMSNKGDAAGLRFAAERGIDTAVIAHRDYPTRDAFDAALGDAVERYQPRLVALAGFMRVLTARFVDRFAGRLVNIHPSLLPAFPGLDTHERALEAGVKVHGCTVHFVTTELDHGPIIIQAAVPVRADDDADRLAARVLREEHVVFPKAVRWFLDQRLELEGGRVRVKNDDAQLVFSDRA